jgi:CreA protein
MKKLLLPALLLCCAPVFADEIGSVNTEWKLLGSHKLVVEVYDDPKVQGVSCYVSKPQKGGLGGLVGVAEEVSDVSIACRQVAPIKFTEAVPKQENVFTERRSLIFKTLHIVRMVDAARNTLVYLTYTDKLVNGSPKNSVTAVPIESSIKIPLK